MKWMNKYRKVEKAFSLDQNPWKIPVKVLIFSKV